ncbi:radical SAM protein [Zooshikella harenae]|uniref:Radical SAM protein n=1 Tax=Zooshikella harenae TaxID=2827238 RepID=A0ABS5ZCS0_9GAMM|nr:radical SAM protein [Zooshikella harenae]MBU2711863.1 radical SAM protein [Zooshikella harenae]
MQLIPVKQTHSVNWLITPDGQPRGYIAPHTLQELWFHTGTACNLRCPFCLEGSKPGDNRLELMKLEDIQPWIHEALCLGVQQFSFTGGEPFIAKDMVKILEYASQYRPCLVLTNGTAPLLQRLPQLKPLISSPYSIRFRISIDYPDAVQHDKDRGAGSFLMALKALYELHQIGFPVSVARQQPREENSEDVTNQYRMLLDNIGLPHSTPIIPFPDFAPPFTHSKTPQITEYCMRTYHSPTSRQQFMCAFSKMVVKIRGRLRVYACTLVDDDPDYDLGANLHESMHQQIRLGHHRCYSCFAFGASCSEGT